MWNISIWAVISQDALWHFKMKSIHTRDTDFGIDGSYCWCHQRSVLFQNVHCYWHHIWILREDWRNCFLKRYLISDYTIHAVIFCLQCWWWWDCEILMVKDFTTSSQISFLRAEAWLGSKMGTGLGSLWNGWDLLIPWHLNLQVEPGLRSVIEDPPCLKTLRRSYLWSNILSGGNCSSEGTELLMKNWGRLLSHILSNILICFLLAALSWKILVCFQQRFDWRFCLLKHSSGFHWLATCSILDNNHASPTAILLQNQLWRKRGH